MPGFIGWMTEKGKSGVYERFVMPRPDWLTVVGVYVRVWIVVYGVFSLLAMVLSHEFLKPWYAIWLSWIIGVPVAAGVGLVSAGIAWVVDRLRKPKVVREVRKDLQRAQREHLIGVVCGGIATVAALFANINPFGESGDFSWTNIVDSLMTGALTYALWRKQLWAGVLLLLYFTIWKMALWSHLQPRAAFWAGIVLAWFLWRGVAGLVWVRRLERCLEGRWVDPDGTIQIAEGKD